jgi:hypothetical protein
MLVRHADRSKIMLASADVINFLFVTNSLTSEGSIISNK